MTIVQRDLRDLIPFARNARTHSPAQIDVIKGLLLRLGWANPIKTAGLNILAGHGTTQAALALAGEGRAPRGVADPWMAPTVDLSHLSEAEQRSYIIADNQTAALAGWDEELLRLELGLLRDGGVDIGSLGFSAPDLASLFNRTKGLTDPDAAPPVPAHPVSRRGDIWCLGEHRLMCGDATVRADVELLLARRTPRLMVTDPPYGVNYDADWRNRAVMIKGEQVGQHGSRAIGAVQNDDRADWSQAWALFPGAVSYVWHGGLHSGLVDMSLAAAGFQVRAQIVWVKTRPVISRGAYHWQHEPALYAVRPDESDGWARFVDDHEVAGYAVRKGKTAAWEGGRKQSTVWFIEHLKSDTGHSTQKPVECMRRPLENNSQPGDLVYDPFVGSGTTLIAAEIAARVCLALEIEPGYTDVAVQRWEAFTGKQVQLLDGGASFDQVRAARVGEQRTTARRRRAVHKEPAS